MCLGSRSGFPALLLAAVRECCPLAAGLALPCLALAADCFFFLLAAAAALRLDVFPFLFPAFFSFFSFCFFPPFLFCFEFFFPGGVVFERTRWETVGVAFALSGPELPQAGRPRTPTCPFGTGLAEPSADDLRLVMRSFGVLQISPSAGLGAAFRLLAVLVSSPASWDGEHCLGTHCTNSNSSIHPIQIPRVLP